MRRIYMSLMAAALLVAGCNDQGAQQAQEDPKGTLVEALESLEQTEGLTMTATVESTTESLQALAADEGDQLSTEDAQKILDSSVTFSGKQVDDPADTQTDMSVNIAGNEDAVELRVVGTTLYARADVEGIMETFGEDPAQLQGIARQAAAQGFDFVGPALEGEWLSIEGIDQLAQTLTGAAPATPSAEQQRLIENFTAAMKQSTEVTAAGEDDAGAHLVATLPLRQTYQHFLELAKGLGQGLPTAQQFPPVSEVPNENVKIDTWVDDGRLSQVEFDFLQLEDIVEGEDAPEGVEQLAFRVAIDEFTDEVEAPEGATNVNVQKILQIFLSGMGAAAAAGQPAAMP